VLLANPRWERRLLRFLEESGVGRIMESGEDENETHGRMNYLGARGEGGRRLILILFFSFLFFFLSFFLFVCCD
jgi:hypothetical protein